MLDILKFIFENPWHYIGFIILWWALISPFRFVICKDDEEREESNAIE